MLMEKMKRGEVVIGPFIKLADPAVVEIFALAGFDFVILDMEHGPHSILTLQNMVRAAELHGIAPIIRVSENNSGQIQRALDIGAIGVQVPQINSKEEAERLIKAAKFASEGERGVCCFVRAAYYSFKSKDEYFKDSNEKTLVIAHIEGEEGVNNLQSILSLDLDLLFIGPYDLSQSMGLPGEVKHPLVVERIKEISYMAKKKEKILGTFVDDIPTAHFYRDLGFQYISFSVDVGILADASRSIIHRFRVSEAKR